jgi:NAD(P) transhydrogenase subunit alpha
MKMFVPREAAPETRVAMVPEVAKKLVGLGAEVLVESGLGEQIGFSDSTYQQAGASVVETVIGYDTADVVARLGVPVREDIARLRKGCVHISYLDPFRRTGPLVQLAQGGVSAICMELIPRTTIAQKMDALSSQANLAGYVAVIVAADRLDRIFPMMMTPAGTIPPAKVFIIGAGVAGLQAIATAKRLGARVEAFDTRPEVAEQVRSLGARFVEVDLGETGQTEDGYARELTPEQLERQREAMARHAAAADVVITTAQVFGRPAPRILTREMVEGMKPDSVVVDMAVETGGNVEGSQPGREVEINGVRVIGPGNLPGQVASHASLMYASNLFNLVEHFWDDEQKTLALNTDDEIMDGCLVAHDGEIRNEQLKALVDEKGED